MRTTPRTRRAHLAAAAMHYALCAAALGQPQPSPGDARDQPPDSRRELLAAQQEAFQAALRAVSPVIVRIDTIGGAQPVRREGEPGEEGRVAAGFRQADGPTTGVIWSEDGDILTSSINFVRDPFIITVTLADGRRFVARLVARDRHARLALLRIDAEGLPTPTLLPTAQVRPGQWALVAGFGHGSQTPALSVGIVSAIGRAAGMAVQTDAKTSPANYGGPLFDVEGRVIGICVPLSPTDDDELAGVEWYDSGIGFAVHNAYIEQRLARLRAGHDLYRGLIGVNLEERTMPGAATPDPNDVGPPGVRVIGETAGPAAAAGIRPGDIITAIEDSPTPRRLDFRRAIARYAAGDEVALHLWREGTTRSVRLRLASAAELVAPATQPAEPSTAPP